MARKSFWAYSKNDYNGERSTVVFGLPDLTALNVGAVLPQIGTLEEALDNITNGVTVETVLTFERNRQGTGKATATSKEAQREKKWLIRYHDRSTFRAFTLEIPTADLTYLPDNHKDEINLSVGSSERTGVWNAFADAFEAVVDTSDGNDAVIDSAEYVGSRY